MTYYTLPKLFRNNNNNIINKINIKSKPVSEIVNDSLLEKLLNTLINDSNKQKYEEIKALYSFTDLLNLKLSDEIYHPKSYFAFIEISKITDIFNRSNLISLHISDTYDYVDALYQLRKDKDEYLFLSEHFFSLDLPKYIKYNCLNKNNFNDIIKQYVNSIDLVCINYDDMNSIVKYLFVSFLVQCHGGNLILKIKRLNNNISKEMIYLLMSLYENVTIIKPKIVNSVNEYKYIVCVNMYANLTNHYDYLFNILNEINNIDSLCENIINILNTCVPQVLINKIDECELIMSENTLQTHMKIFNSIQINNINIKSLEKKGENESKNWLKENNMIK